MKRIITLLLALAMLLTLSPAVSAEELKGSCGKGVNWRFDTETGVFRVTGNGPMKDYVNGETPWSHIRSQIKTAVIEPGVTNLGDYTFFYCDNLESISLPEGLTRIGMCGIYECPKLEKLTLPDTVETICTISRTGLRRIVLPKGLKTIADGGFSYNDHLHSVVFNEGLETIGTSAFVSCDSLTSAFLPDTVTTIGGSAFQYCYNLTSLKLSAGLSTLPGDMCYHCENLVYVEFPDSIRTIDYNVFLGCTSLKQVKLNEGLEFVGQSAFANTAIEQLVLPESMVYVAADAFNAPTLRKVAVLSKDCEYFTHPWNNNLGDPSRVEVYGYDESTTLTYAIDKDYYFEFINEENLWEDELPPMPEEPPYAWVENPFTDVQDAKRFYYTPVLWAYDNAITSGMTADSFAPDGNCERGQVVTFLWRSMNKPETTVDQMPFIDVNKLEYFYTPVLWAFENQITTGMDDTHFAPRNTVTRGQFVTFLWRAVGEPEAKQEAVFTDVPAGAYYHDAVAWAVSEGITLGMGDGLFNPDGPCTRGLVVTFLYRLQEQQAE